MRFAGGPGPAGDRPGLDQNAPDFQVIDHQVVRPPDADAQAKFGLDRLGDGNSRCTGQESTPCRRERNADDDRAED